MICEEAMALMSAKLDGELTQAQAEALGAHLEHCPDCRRLMEAMEDLDQKLTTLREPAPEGLKKGVLYRIDQATGKAKKPGLRRWFGPGTAIGAVAAVLVLLVGLGLIPLGRTLGLKSAEPQSAAETNAPDTLGGEFYYAPAEGAKAADVDGTGNAYTNIGRSEAIAPAQAEPETEAFQDDYYLSGGNSEALRADAQPITEAARAACSALSREENALVLLYTEFPAESLFRLLEQEEPQLYALIEGLKPEQADGLILYRTDCGTALAIHEWLLEKLPHSELMEGNAQEAEYRLRVRMEELDPECGSLYRVISWESVDHPVPWPGTWPEGWALRLRTEENWSFFFPSEDYTPNADKTAWLAFYTSS